MCRSKESGQASRGRQQQRDSNSRGRGRRQQRNSSRYTWTATRDVHYTETHKPPAADAGESFEQLSLNAIFTSLDAISHESKDEAFTHVRLRQDKEKRIVNLLVKVDSGSQANTITLRVYRRMFPSSLDAEGFRRRGHLKDTDCVL